MFAPTPEPSQPSADGPRSPSWRRWLALLLPHLLTAALAIALSLAIGALLRPTSLAWVAPAVPTAAPASTAPAAPTPTATTAPAPAPDIVRQELLDLRAENDRVWAAIYLSKAISQIADAEAQMRNNDLENVAQSLVAVDGSLDQAYERADESIKSPIAELRRTAGLLHDDLYVRPEGMDTRLVVLRQTILALVGERR